MAAQTGLSATGLVNCSDVSRPVALSAEAAPFTPLGTDSWRLGSSSDAEKQFSRCAARLRALRASSDQLREELNLLFDQILSENYNKTFEPSISIRPEVPNTRFGLDVTSVFNVTCDTEKGSDMSWFAARVDMKKRPKSNQVLLSQRQSYIVQRVMKSRTSPTSR